MADRPCDGEDQIPQIPSGGDPMEYSSSKETGPAPGPFKESKTE